MSVEEEQILIAEYKFNKKHGALPVFWYDYKEYKISGMFAQSKSRELYKYENYKYLMNTHFYNIGCPHDVNFKDESTIDDLVLPPEIKDIPKEEYFRYFFGTYKDEDGEIHNLNRYISRNDVQKYSKDKIQKYREDGTKGFY